MNAASVDRGENDDIRLPAERGVRFSSRERQRPAYLSDYVLDRYMTDSAVEDPELITTSHVSGASENTRLSRVSRQSSIRSRMSDRQLAEVERLKRQAELDEMRLKSEEERIIDHEIRKLEDVAFDARLQLDKESEILRRKTEKVEREVAQRREQQLRDMERKRKIREAERKLLEAELISNIVKDENPWELTPLVPKHKSVAFSPTRDSVNVKTEENSKHDVETPVTVNSKHTMPSQSTMPSQPTSPSKHAMPAKPTVSSQDAMPLNQTDYLPNTSNHMPSSTMPLYSSMPSPYTMPYTPCQVPNLTDRVSSNTMSYTMPSTVPPTVPNTMYAPYATQPPFVPQVQPPMPNMTELLISSSYGIPKPSLPTFVNGRERDFALLKMALQHLVNIHPHLDERYKYQVLMGQLGGKAKTLAESYMYETCPYTMALQALQEKYGQPRQLIQSELGSILALPAIRPGDSDGFDNLALAVQSLVGMLRSLEGEGGSELNCGSHVDRLLIKLAPGMRDGFIEHCLKLDIHESYNLINFNDWLQLKSRAKRMANNAVSSYEKQDKMKPHYSKRSHAPTAAFFGKSKPLPSEPKKSLKKDVPETASKGYCPKCESSDHYLSSCQEIKKMNLDAILKWLNGRCRKCGRKHKMEGCNLKKPCHACNELHLTILHDANSHTEQKVFCTKLEQSPAYIDQPSRPYLTMLKIVEVTLHGPNDSCMDAHAILDDGSQRTMLMAPIVKQLRLNKRRDKILLTTIRREPFMCEGLSVDLEISPRNNPNSRFTVRGAFASDTLALSEYSYPTEELKDKWPHLRHPSLPVIDKVKPVILIGSDCTELIVPDKPIIFGPPSTPVAVHTKLGWSLQGPAHTACQMEEQHSFFINQVPSFSDFHQDVERLWQMDVLPYSTKDFTRSKQDEHALQTLESETKRINVDGVMRYATPLLRTKDGAQFHATAESMLPNLRRTEKRLRNQPELAEVHNQLIHNLVEAGSVKVISNDEAENSAESWYIPHHLVHHNDKHRLVFHCSYEADGQNLNKKLLPGPQLGSSLLGVLLRFRQNPVAISGDIKGMFHQVRLLDKDKPLLRFLWRDIEDDRDPDIYQWEVLPFGTTCSPCCATFALRKHVNDHRNGNENVYQSVTNAYYVDNCLQSVPTIAEAKGLVHQMSTLLDEGGFHLRQWASNVPDVVSGVNPEDRSSDCELWLTLDDCQPSEGALGMRWHCDADDLSFKCKEIPYECLTMRVIYRILASQYDPLGYIAPYTARAKCIVQELWNKKRDWSAPLEAGTLRDLWTAWENELKDIVHIRLPRCYTPWHVDPQGATRELHVFCDASERLYGSVAYLRTETAGGQIYVSFVQSRSRVAPKRQQSIPRLELCAALTGAQLANVLQKEITLPIANVFLWSDSTTVLTWLHSESCRYKVFVGTRISEIQTLTNVTQWHYVDTKDNPADDVTRGKTLSELSKDTRWKLGPTFLSLPHQQWPKKESPYTSNDSTELRSTFCATVMVSNLKIVDPAECATWDELVTKTMEGSDGAAETAENRKRVEMQLLREVQLQCFPDDFASLVKGDRLPSKSRLLQLDPMLDKVDQLIRVGGRLRRSEELPDDTKHPIVLEPKHPITRLLISKYDHDLLHSGAERVFAEIRRSYWILRGREAVRSHQRRCPVCRKWRANPQVPKMADLPPSRLRLFKPPFYSTGTDCFGPMQVKVGRRSEKRWGIIFKCMTTRAVHFDLLDKMDTDAYLMSLRRFIARRGKPYEIWSDNGTNFKGGMKELSEAWEVMVPSLTTQLAKQKINFKFNPPSAPHFGGVWEREIKSVKYGLKVALGQQNVTEPVLQTVLAEVEGILNSKPLSYVSSDVSDIDPVTPNVLLNGRRDSSMPQVVYPEDEILSRRRWRHSQVLADHFWKHFIRDYLPKLQLRQKWQNDRKDHKDIGCGDVVMILDPQSVRSAWQVGRVSEIFPGVDGRVRAATVKVGEQRILRPVCRLIRLPECPDD